MTRQPCDAAKRAISTRRRLCFCVAVLLGLAQTASLPVRAQARQGRGAAADVSGVGVPAAAGARVLGAVSDRDGAMVPGATLVLTPVGGAVVRTAVSDAEGRFAFSDLPAGSFLLTASAPGFEAFAYPEIALRAGESRELIDISLSLPKSYADVLVTESTRERADVELHAAEQQRVLGVFPNFYTSFADAAPMDSRQKFSLALRATTDPTAFFTAAAVATGEQINNTFPSYGRGMQGFGKRYGAAYADGFSGKMIGSALLPSVFRQDPRYFYMGTGGFKRRLLHVVGSAVLARGDNGRTEPNYSHILGNAAAGAMSTLYHPVADSAGKLALDNALLGTVGEAAVNFAREFLLKPFTRGAPAFPSTRP